MKAPAPWPPPTYETGDPIIVPERDANRVTSAPDAPPADTDPARATSKAGVTFKEATAAMERLGAALFRSVMIPEDQPFEMDENQRPIPPRLESERVYTEAEVSEIDAANQALRNAGEESTRYWWRRVGDRYRQVRADERPIGIALESAPAGGTVTVQLERLDQNGVPITSDPQRLPPDQRPHPGPPLVGRNANVLLGPEAGRSRPNPGAFPRTRSDGVFANDMTDEQMADARRPAERHDDMQDAIVAGLRGVARDPRRDEIGNGVTHEELQNATTPAERYDVLWRAGLIDGRYAGPGAAPEREPPPLRPVASRPVVPDDPRKRRLRVRT